MSDSKQPETDTETAEGRKPLEARLEALNGKRGLLKVGPIFRQGALIEYTGLEAIRTPELATGSSLITIGVTTFTDDPARALSLARYIGGSNRGLPVFGGRLRVHFDSHGDLSVVSASILPGIAADAALSGFVLDDAALARYLVM